MKTQFSVLVCFLALLLALPAAAQVWEEWVARWSSLGACNDEACAVAVDGEGNVYVTGEADYGDSSDICTIKYNAEGESQWIAFYGLYGIGGSFPADLAVSDNGNVYVTGRTCDSNYYVDYITIKYDCYGTERWAVRYNGPLNGADAAQALALDQNGNVYVTGQSTGSVVFTDYATIKYDSNGTELWVARYDGPGHKWDEANDIIVDAEGSVIVTGSSESGETWTYPDFATIKYDAHGQELWIARYSYNDYSFDRAFRVALDTDGNIYIAGTSTGALQNYDYVTIKYDQFGQEQWIAWYDGPVHGKDYLSDLAVDGVGNVCITGSSDSNLSYPFNEDYATVKYDPNGQDEWVARYNGPANAQDYAGAVKFDLSGNVYVLGMSNAWEAGQNFDYVTLKYDSLGQEQWLARYNGSADKNDIPASLAIGVDGFVYVTGADCADTLIPLTRDYATVKYSQALGVGGDIQMNGVPTMILLHPPHPNPFNAGTVIRFQLPVANYVKLEILDITGRVVGAHGSAPPIGGGSTPALRWYPAGTHEFPFDGSGLPSGIYLCRIAAGEWSAAQKLVLIK